MSDALGILRDAEIIVLVDWPAPEVPESLVRAGFTVFVKGGPGPHDYARRELRDGELVSTKLDRRPARADLVFAFRPLTELRGIAMLAQELGARTLWWHAGPSGASPADSRSAREIAEEAGLAFVDDVYIADVARELPAQ